MRCFQNVSSHLADTGVFVVTAFVPDVARFDRGQRVTAMDVGLDSVRIDIAKHDLLQQRISASILTIRTGGVELLPVELRYAWPAELDLMAQLAGLRLRERWAGWNREPFTAESGAHVSAYERARGQAGG